MKKILAFIMSILLAFSVLSISVSAEEASENIVVTYGETNFIFANDTPNKGLISKYTKNIQLNTKKF